MASIEQGKNVGSSTHYESILQQRKSGKVVIRRRDEMCDSPFDDEGENIDLMSISNFSKRYMSEATSLMKT